MNRFTIASRILVAVLVVSLFGHFYVLGQYWQDHRYLKRLATHVTDPNAPPSEQTKQILAFFRDKSQDTNRSHFLFPFLDFLRPTARQVADSGGDCADRSRLTVILLKMRNIPAEKWTLYYPKGHPEHSVVEVETEQGKMAVDPLFGLFYPRPSGGYYGVAELRENPDLVRQRIAEMEARHQEPLAAPIERYSVEAYTYAYATTYNWQKSAFTRFVYRTLHGVLGSRVDDVRRPVWPEEPALVLSIGFGLLELLLIISLLLLARFAPRPATQQVRTRGPHHNNSVPAQA
jgi:hypothetical protein